MFKADSGLILVESFYMEVKFTVFIADSGRVDTLLCLNWDIAEKGLMAEDLPSSFKVSILDWFC